MTTYRGQDRFNIPVSDGPSTIHNRDSQYGGTFANIPAIQRFQAIASSLDERLGELGKPLKPYLPGIGRILIVATFIEDSWRLITRWGEQSRFLKNQRGIPYIFVYLFLLLNIVSMLGGSYCVVAKKYLLHAVGVLAGVLVTQGIVYGLLFDLQFFFRNLSLIGGLLLVISDVFSQDRRRLGLPGLPQLDNKDRGRYFQLGGRILMVLLFIAHLIRSRWTSWTLFVNAIALVACGLVVVGFKARFSASLLVLMLFIQNLTTNNYWRLASNNPHRDFLRYEYFQTLSIVGGLILLVNMGAGRISIDEKKKIY